MRADVDGLPVLRDSTSGLGVRVPGDIAASDQFVYPGAGGMTVNFDSADNLSWHHRPRSIGGPCNHPAWVIQVAQLPPQLRVRIDPDDDLHGLVEPVVPMPLAEFRAHIASSRLAWRRATA